MGISWNSISRQFITWLIISFTTSLITCLFDSVLTMEQEISVTESMSLLQVKIKITCVLVPAIKCDSVTHCIEYHVTFCTVTSLCFVCSSVHAKDTYMYTKFSRWSLTNNNTCNSYLTYIVPYFCFLLSHFFSSPHFFFL